MHSLVYFTENFLPDFVLTLIEFRWKRLNPLAKRIGVHLGHFGDVFAVDEEILGLFLESGAVANWTGDVVHERSGPACDAGGSIFVVLALNETDDAFEVDLVNAVDADVFAFHLKGLVGAVKDNVQGLVRDLLHRGIQGKAVFQSDGFKLVENPAARLVFTCRSQPAFLDAQVGIGDELFLVDHGDLTHAVAFGTSTVGRVEGEGVGLRILVGEAGGGTHQQTAEIAHLLGFMVHHHQQAFAIAEGCLHRLGDAALAVVIDFKTVNHDLDVVGFVAVEHHAKLDLTHLAINAYSGETRLADMLK